MSTKLLFIGATGYLGGATLLRLLNHPRRSEFEISIFIRAASKAQGFESYGLRVVLGSLADHDILERECSQTDVLFQSANSDDVPATHAILRGLKKRFETTKTAPIYIHTSGTGVLTDKALGKYATETIYSDLDIPQIETLPITQFHREVDVAITEAGKEGYAKTYIVIPSLIYGIVSNEFTEKGLQNSISTLIPLIIELDIKRGKPIILGEGLNIWPHVEINETADFYPILLDAILSGKNPGNGREGFYFLENGEYTQKQLVETISQNLYKLGKINSDKLVALSDAELEENPILTYLGTNSRCQANRARSLGWKPVKGTAEFMASIEPEILNWIRNNSTA